MILLISSAPARGEVTGFSKCTGGAFCGGPTQMTIGGKSYVRVSGLMKGSTTLGPFSFGPYAAPITVMVPAQPSDCSGTGIVDLVNNSSVFFFLDGFGYFPPLEAAHVFLGDDYIARRGHVLASVQFQKVLTLGVFDSIDLGKANGYYPLAAGIPAPPGFELMATMIVMNDAAVFIKNLGAFIPGACNSRQAIAVGYSQSAFLRRDGLFVSPDFWGTYDGTINVGQPGLFCVGTPTCPIGPTPAGSGKAITIDTETDIQILDSEAVRGDTAWYKVYEVAGTTHVPTEIGALGGFGPRQDPARISPVVRTMVDRMVEWIDGKSVPPPSVYLDASSANPQCEVASAGNLFEPTYLFPGDDLVLDCPALRDPEMGNALPGGVRLPHLATDVDGERVGAPLGGYGGVETVTFYALFGWFPNLSFATAAAGVYNRFTDQELARRYGTFHGQVLDDTLSGRYLGAVARAAEYAESRGWINEEEKRAYIATAHDCAHGKTPSLSDESLLACHGL